MVELDHNNLGQKLLQSWDWVYLYIPQIALHMVLINDVDGTSLVVQWVRLCTLNAGSPGLIPGRETRSHMHTATKSLHAATKKKKMMLHKKVKDLLSICLSKMSYKIHKLDCKPHKFKYFLYSVIYIIGIQ